MLKMKRLLTLIALTFSLGFSGMAMYRSYDLDDRRVRCVTRIYDFKTIDNIIANTYGHYDMFFNKSTGAITKKNRLENRRECKYVTPTKEEVQKFIQDLLNTNIELTDSEREMLNKKLSE